MKPFSLIFFLILIVSIQTFGADFTVNLTTDQHDASLNDNICDIDLANTGLQCSLRAAIEQANFAISSDRVLFNLPPNSIISLTETNGGQIPITNSEQEGLNRLEIIGTGANNLTIDGGAGGNRIFRISSWVTLSDVSLTGGDGSGGDGGAIQLFTGILSLRNANVYRNTTPSNGGAIAGDRINITNSTFSGNAASGCGAIQSSASLTISNSTFSGNRAVGNGGAICTGENTTIRNSTITNNTAVSGGGVLHSGFRFRYGNTIIAGNTATSGVAPEISNSGSAAFSDGNNLIGDSPGDAYNSGNLPAAYQSTDILDTNPQLGQLQNNGGTTPTQALLFNSPAINQGNNALAPGSTDQRGFARISGVYVDIGAYEYQLAPTVALVTVKGRATTQDGRGIANIMVSMTDSTGNTREATTGADGYYSFSDVEAGSAYIITATGKRYTFCQTSQVLNVNDDTTEINFVGTSEKRLRAF